MFRVPNPVRETQIANHYAYMENVALLKYLQQAFKGYEEKAKELGLDRTLAIKTLRKEKNPSAATRLKIAILTLLELGNSIEGKSWLYKHMETVEVQTRLKDDTLLALGLSLLITDISKYVKLDGDKEWKKRVSRISLLTSPSIPMRIARLEDELSTEIKTMLMNRIKDYKQRILLAIFTGDTKLLNSLERENAYTKACFKEKLRLFQRHLWFIYADEVGAFKFRWHTQKDTKVRLSHKEMEGMLLEITSPLLNRLNDVGCRCYLTIEGYYI